MKIETEPYLESIANLPAQGQHIIAHQPGDRLVVYQAYNHHIADFAVKHQYLGGDHFSYNRMSWIKPNFLWMMYRCGWAQKENQERVLAFWISRATFEEVLAQVVFSSFKETYYSSHEAWRAELDARDVRLQWDPDHDPFGEKLERRAIQLGLKGKALQQFGKEGILEIEDVTDFVRTQRQHVIDKDLQRLIVPKERVYVFTDESIKKKIAADG
jgi:hypothetical protein